MPPVSNEPLTVEQVAIYRAVVLDYLKDSKSWINLANQTAPLHLEGPTASGGCNPGFDLEPNPHPVLHLIDPKVAKGMHVTLVDPATQQALLKKSEGLSPEESEHRGFQNGLFTLSEMAFDKDHRRVVVSYSYVCGENCGHGETLILSKTAGKWKINAMCGEWVT